MKRFGVQSLAAVLVLTMLCTGCGSMTADTNSSTNRTTNQTTNQPGSVITDTGSADPDGDGIVGDDTEGYEVEDGDDILDDAGRAVDDAGDAVRDTVDDMTDGNNENNRTNEKTGAKPNANSNGSTTNPQADENAR